MIIEKYGVLLKRISQNDIELIREKRNSHAISSKMIYQKEISIEEQLTWFKSVNNFHNFYYLIFYNNEPIGMINDKNVDWNDKVSEAGLFIWEKRYLNTIVPSLASLCLLEVGFEILDWNETSIEVLKSNSDAIIFNKQVGFIEVENGKKKVARFKLTRQRYDAKARNFILAMTKLNDKKTLKLFLSKEDIDSGLTSQIENVIQNSNRNIKEINCNDGKGHEYSIL